MDDYRIKLHNDLLEQFKEKPNIEGLIETIGIQLNELYAFFLQIFSQRNIKNAVGKQLDGIGDIVCLTRDDAAKIVGDKNITGRNIDDETYRKMLVYKAFVNTCDATYYDMMNAVNILMTGGPLKYGESSDYPATIFLDFEAEEHSADDILLFPYVRPSGVGLRINMNTRNSHHLGCGFSHRINVEKFVDCFEEVVELYDFLADENGNILTDENGAWLCE